MFRAFGNAVDFGLFFVENRVPHGAEFDGSSLIIRSRLHGDLGGIPISKQTYLFQTLLNEKSPTCTKLAKKNTEYFSKQIRHLGFSQGNNMAIYPTTKSTMLGSRH